MDYFDPHTSRILYGTLYPYRSCLQIRHLNHFVHPCQNCSKSCLLSRSIEHFVLWLPDVMYTTIMTGTPLYKS